MIFNQSIKIMVSNIVPEVRKTFFGEESLEGDGREEVAKPTTVVDAAHIAAAIFALSLFLQSAVVTREYSGEILGERV